MACMALAAALLAGLASCRIDYDIEYCDETTRIVYRYNRENTSDTDRLPEYVSTLTEYLFDGDGVLLDEREVALDDCTGAYTSDRELPPGRYSVIAVGNRTAMSQVTYGSGGTTVGETRRDGMLLSLRNRTRTEEPFANCGRLYHAYRTFSVEEGLPTRVKADAVHSHCVIRFTIRWRSTPPANAKDYYVQLRDVPSEYGLMPEYVYPAPGAACAEHDFDGHDAYNRICEEVIHHIPRVYNDRNVVTHRREVKRVTDEIMGETVTYRLRNDGRTMFSLHTADGTRVMKDVHLNHFLTAMEIDLDRTLRQEYDIHFDIDDDAGLVYVYFANVGDWDEGEWFQ